MIFRSTELQQKLEFDIFQEGLFRTLVSSINVVLNTIPVAAGQYLLFIFFCLLKAEHFLGFLAFSKK